MSSMLHLQVRHRTREVAGVEIFYREAGREDAPAVCLLHGFPSSSFQYRHLMPALAQRYRVLAPDFPAFGFSGCPEHTRYAYTFDHYADAIEELLHGLGVRRCALFLHDYGAQVGFRLALRSPERVGAIVVQNSEAYCADGRSDSWSATEDYWRDPSPSKREALRKRLFTVESIRNEFLEHLAPKTIELLDPAVMDLAWTQISRRGVVEALLDLHLDYHTNVALYPAVQAYLRQYQPPALIVWGREDQYYSPAAAQAYKRDLPTAHIEVIDGGHWALETHGPQVIELTVGFLRQHWPDDSR